MESADATQTKVKDAIYSTSRLHAQDKSCEDTSKEQTHVSNTLQAAFDARFNSTDDIHRKIDAAQVAHNSHESARASFLPDDHHHYQQTCRYGLIERAIYMPEDGGGRGDSVRPLAGLLDTALCLVVDYCNLR